LFQGRFRSICLKDAGAWARAADYIHLNPGRAGIVPMSQWGSFRWSSLRPLTKGPRFPGLQPQDWRETLGIQDSPDGSKDYQRRLEARMLDDETAGANEQDKLSRGWAIGSEIWKQDPTLHPVEIDSRGPGSEPLEPRAIMILKWNSALVDRLAELGRTRDDLRRSPKNGSWKVALADELRRKRGAYEPRVGKGRYGARLPLAV